jgi:NADPH2:quinone reductase
MAHAVVATAFGGPEVLDVVDVPTLSPGSGEISVDVRASGTNPVDYKVYSGSFSRDPGQLPIRLGMEAAGVVTEVGSDADGPSGPIQPGDSVILYRIEGGYADHVVVPATAAVPKPSTLSFEEASGLMLAGATAVHSLAAIGVKPGDTILLHGAAGGVGIMTVQLAVQAGVRVIGTARAGSHDLLRDVGAEPVVYGEGLVERVRALAPGGVDGAIDTVGSDEATDASLALVGDRDRIATIVSSPRSFQLGLKVLGAAPGADPGTKIRAAARLELVELAEAGKLRVYVAGTYSLGEAAAAHRELMAGHTHGKIVLVPERPAERPTRGVET